jgi:formylmethanofuran:tetrahydromethanopterin formyltransferase
MPTSAFFNMINETFDESTVNEVIDIIIDSIDQDTLKTSMKQSITKFYGGEK